MLAGRVWERDCMGQDEGGDLSGGVSSQSGLVRVGRQIIEQRRGTSEAVQRPGLLQ